MYSKTLNETLGNEFCFPSTHHVPLHFTLGNIALRVFGKQNSLSPLGPVIKCSLLKTVSLDKFKNFHWLSHVNNKHPTQGGGGGIRNTLSCFIPPIKMGITSGLMSHLAGSYADFTTTIVISKHVIFGTISICFENL